MPGPTAISRASRWLAPLWALLVLFLTLMPGDDVPRWEWARLVHFDKWVHAGLFGVQTVLCGLALHEARNWGRAWAPLLIALCVAITFGGAIEVVQTIMAWGRQGEWSDLLADSVGAMLGFAYLRKRLE